MSFAALRSWWQARTAWEKTALLLWGVMLLFVSVRVVYQPAAKTVYPIFSSTSRLWWSGIDLYEPGRPKDVQDGYRYSPTFAILFTPCAIFPDAVGGVVWRLASVAALMGALVWLARCVLPLSLSRDQLAWLALGCLPLSLQSVNNGQANVIVTALLVATVAAVKTERWNLASVLMALAFVCKLYPIALGLLLIVLYPRRLGVRMLLACAVGLLLPFLFQNPAYVADQYGKWVEQLSADDRHDFALEQGYRDLWLLIRLYGVPASWKVYQLLQVGSGAGIALLLWVRQQRGWPARALLTSTLALASAWMMLLGPATESSSFVLMAPSFAWSLVEAWQAGASRRRALLVGSVALFAVAVLMGSFSHTVKIHALGVHSWATLLYFVYLLTEPASPTAQAVQQLPNARAA